MGNVVGIQCGDALIGGCWDCIAKKSRHVYKLEENLVALQAAIDQLTELRNDVIRTVINQQTPQMEQPDQVSGWLSTVYDTITQVSEVLSRGAQQRQNLCMAGYCSNNCMSSYMFGKSVWQSLKRVNALIAKAEFKQVVINAPPRQLEFKLQELSGAKAELQALKEDLEQRISLEEGPQNRTLQQVQLWLSKAETTLADANKLIENGPQEINKLLSGDISSYMFVGRVVQKLEDIASLHAKGDFSQVIAKAIPSRVVERNLKPTVGNEEMLEAAWSVLHEVEVGILGIYGMGGVGKTTLLTQINNKFAGNPCDFNVVIWVVVSKDLKLEKIQESIWKQIRSRDDHWMAKDIQEKAQDIFHVLQRKKFVLLLDDVWQQFDLEDIGVPLPSLSNGSKVVLTTRSFAICKQMEASKTMIVKPLNAGEAWQLFKEKVGNIDADFVHVAEKVADECGGLPIALITIGRAMASRSTLEEWQHALKVLRRSVSNLQAMEDELYQGMEAHVFKRLKFSYDYLPNDKVRSCFLYCALFPEDFMILKNDLVSCWVAEKFCSRDEGYVILHTLIRQCLLEKEGKYVKLHDVIRDMAVWIACKIEKEKHNFFIQAGAQLVLLPQVEEWEGATKVSFMANSFKTIGGCPRCCDLVTLFLSRNPNLKAISEGFFQAMTRLTVLDLSHTSIEELPLEISHLESLEFLNLSYTNLKKLPIEMRSLIRLKHFSLEGTGYLRMIPVQMISTLSKLQVLNMFKCGSVFYDDEGKYCNMFIKELLCLKNLCELKLTVSSASFLGRICENQILLNSLYALYLFNCQGHESLDISSLASAKQLNLLLIVANHALKELVIEVNEIQAPSSSLNNNRISFCGLREVHVLDNSKMQHITWLIFLPNLTVLRVSENRKMIEIISAEKLSKHQAKGERLHLFAKLQVLELSQLPFLKTISPVALSFPCLTQVNISECPRLKKLPLNSESVEGCNVVIKAEESWWNDLTWEDDETRSAFSSCFQSHGRARRIIGKSENSNVLPSSTFLRFSLP